VGFRKGFKAAIFWLGFVGVLSVAVLLPKKDASAASSLWQLTDSYNFSRNASPLDSDNNGEPEHIAGWNTLFAEVPNSGDIEANANYSDYGVRASDGILKIVTSRHCVTYDEEELTEANVSSAPCPSGKSTKYSSGRIQSTKFYSGDIIVEGAIMLPANAVPGVRNAFWLKNAEPYCSQSSRVNKSRLGEIDILEWYGFDKMQADLTTYVT